MYVRNLTLSVSEEKIREVFERFGKVDRVKKIKDYAFVHFDDRERAAEAMAALNHQDLNGSPLEISLAKPPSDKKKKEEMLRKREQRMIRNMPHRYNHSHISGNARIHIYYREKGTQRILVKFMLEAKSFIRF